MLHRIYLVYRIVVIWKVVNLSHKSTIIFLQEISPLNIKELQTVHNMRAQALEKANPDIFTPKGKTGVKRKRPELGSGKENMPQKVCFCS